MYNRKINQFAHNKNRQIKENTKQLTLSKERKKVE